MQNSLPQIQFGTKRSIFFYSDSLHSLMFPFQPSASLLQFSTPLRNRDVGAKIALLTPRGHAIPTVPSYISSSPTCTTCTHHSPIHQVSQLTPSHMTQGPKPQMERGRLLVGQPCFRGKGFKERDQTTWKVTGPGRKTVLVSSCLTHLTFLPPVSFSFLPSSWHMDHWARV